MYGADQLPLFPLQPVEVDAQTLGRFAESGIENMGGQAAGAAHGFSLLTHWRGMLSEAARTSC
jgi:hypothetical protein